MAKLEDLIYSRLCNNEKLIKLLATHKGVPAIFFQSAPGDMSIGWNKKQQYPRLTCMVDMKADAERKTSGQLTINIWCSETRTMPEDIEPIVREIFCGVFLTPSRAETYSLAWSRSDPFEVQDTLPQIVGISASFDILEFPRQITSDPDPVLAINEYTRCLCPNCKIIGYDTLPEEYIPTKECPAFYWRFGSMGVEKVSWAVSWVVGILGGHIFAPSTEDRLDWLKVIAQRIAIDEEAIMLDGSPMFFTALKADSAADHLRNGQIQLKVRYGILRKREQAIYPLLNKGME